MGLELLSIREHIESMNSALYLNTTIDQRDSPGAGVSKHISALDGIRGLAILIVFAHHYGDLSRSSQPVLRLIENLKECGWLGVDLFFALSGFLITGILWESRFDPRRMINFYSRRVLRLFPLYYGVWLLLAVYTAASHLPWLPGYWAYLLYAGNFISTHTIAVGPFLVSQFWSLAVEEQFYLVWPLILWRVKTIGHAAGVLIGLFAASLLIKLGIAFYTGFSGDHLLLFRLLWTHAEPLAMGGLTALAWRTCNRDKLARSAAVVFPVSCAFLVLTGMAFHGLQENSPGPLCLSLPALAFASSSLIVLAIRRDTMAHRIMNHAILRFYGRYSYGFYVYHFLLRGVLRSLLYAPLGVIYLFLCLAALTGLSVLSYHLFELPFLKRKRFFAPKQEPATVPYHQPQLSFDQREV
jgi:peptidoglycan/LPS O-acetylase OafA/YrhL